MLYRGPIWRGEGILNAKRAPSLAAYYGVGPGQIPIHHTPSEPSGITLDENGKVTASINRGGAGAVFDLIGVPETAPKIGANAFDFDFEAGSNLEFATQPDVNGVHIVAAGYRDPSAPVLAQARILSGPGITGWWTYLSGTVTSWLARVNFTTLGVNLNVSVGNGSYVGWGIHELRVSEGQVTYIINGVTVGSEPISSAVATYISHLGALRVADYTPKYIGDFGSVICDSGHSAANPEPAVLLARQTLAAQYGVVL